MCGIAGIMCLKRGMCDKEQLLSVLNNMLKSIAHRGPDGEGYKVLDEGQVYLGHRRLSIVDLSSLASQPMQTYSKRYTLSYNGEIYNFKELKRILQDKGHIFQTHSDTEVLLQAYEEWGIECLNRLNGIFAFAIWDNYKKELVLARDRYGTKPLYYAQVGNQVVFASEYKAIICHPLFERKVNLNTLKEYFTFQNIFSYNTLLDNIKILEPGSYIRITSDAGEIPQPIKYWDFKFEEQELGISEKEYEEEVNRLFEQAVKRQLFSDVSLGTYLSGGIDSGSITAVASKYIQDLKTFTCGFDLRSASGMELSFDEREKAEYMSYLFKTEHYEMVLKAGDMERCMQKLVWHLEDPRVGQSYPNFYAAKLASNFVKVVLAGTGSDELFAGYPWRYYRTSENNTFDKYVNEYFDYWQRLLKEEEQQSFMTPIYEEVKNYSMYDVFRNIWKDINLKEMSVEQCINSSLYLEAKTFLHGLLIVEDKLSMAHGLETRVPFLDNDLVDFAMKMPVRYKLSKVREKNKIDENAVGTKVDAYYRQYNDGKIILRNVMGRYVPKEISEGKKQGFSAPDASWFRGDSLDYVESIISNPNAKIYTYLDKKSVRNIFNNHIKGIENKRLLIWSIINYEVWLEQFI